MLGELVPCGGGDSFPLLQAKIIVGRHPDCDICLRFKSMSGNHCELTFSEGCWFVHDSGSRNGTAVNGVCCVQKTQLVPHDVISFANQRYSIVFTAADHRPSTAVDTEEEAIAFGFLDDSPASARDTAAKREPIQKPRRTTKKSYLGKLVPCGGGDPIPLLEPELLVGRKRHCDICMEFPTVSSEHCKLKFEDGYWFVHDLGSHNGIKVDGIPCQSKCLLTESILSISKHRYEIIYTPTGDAPPPEEDPFAQSLLEKLGLEKRATAKNPPKWMQVDDGHVTETKWTLDEND